MTRNHLFAAFVLLVPLVAGCPDSGSLIPPDENVPDAMDMTTLSPDLTGGLPSPDFVVSNPDGGGTPPPAPALGVQIDRMGRPAVNTALTDPFNATTREAGVKNDYNADSNMATWPATWGDEIGLNLAILDSIDRTCGNQAAYAIANTYATLAGVLANDFLFLDTTTDNCTLYLGREAQALGVIPGPECGGRTPRYDVMDVTYTLLVSGPGGLATPISDGVPADDATTSLTAFPFLAAPQ